MGIFILLALITVPGLWCYPLLTRYTKKDLGYVEKWAFILGTSFALTTLVLIGLMLLNIFSLTILIVFYGLFLIAYVVKYKGLVLPFWKESLTQIKNAKLPFVMALFIVLISIVLFFQPTQYFFGGRDPGVYVNTALQISHNNELKKPAPLLDEVKSQYPYVFEDKGIRYPAVYIETRQGVTNINPQFYHAYSIWLGISHKLFGSDKFLYITPIMALISLLMIYVATKEMFNKWVGLIATLLLCINISQIWYARGPYTEILSQLLLWFSMYTLIKACRNKDSVLGLIAGLSIGASILVRLDNIFFLPAVVFYLILMYLKKEGLSTRWANMVIIGFIGSFILLGSYIMMFGREYTQYQLIRNTPLPDFLTLPKLFVILLVLGVILSFITYFLRKPLVRLINLIQNHSRIIFAIVGVFTVFIFFYLYFIRPNVLIPNLTSAGGRSYREETLVRLGWYLTRMGIFLSMAGFIYFIQTKLRREHTLFLFMIVTNFALYLYDAKIYPDHFWAVRRHVPFIIPTFIIFLSYAAYSLGKIKIKHFKPWLVTGVVVLYFSGKFILAAYPFIIHTEYEGVREGLDIFAQNFEQGSIIVTDDSNSSRLVGTPLDFIYDKNVLVLKQDYNQKTFQRFIQDKKSNGIPVYLLIDSSYQNMQSPYTSYRFLNQVGFNFETAKPSELERPHEVIQNSRMFNIYESLPSNIYTGQLFLDVGTPEDINYEYNGFYNSEGDKDTTRRWAQGKADIRLLLEPQMFADKENCRLNIKAMRLMPDELTNPDLKITINGEFIGSIPLTDEMTDYFIDFSSSLVSGDGIILLEFDTKAFSPKDLMINEDARELGFLLESLKIETSE